MSRYTDLRDELIRLGAEFESHRHRLAPLKHDLIPGPDGENWTDEMFRSFKAANDRVDGVEWESWELWEDRSACGRFWGPHRAAAWVREFKQLAARACLIVDQIGLLDKREAKEGTEEEAEVGEPVPEGFQVKMPMGRRMERLNEVGAEFVWIELLHEWGNRFPTSRFLGEPEIWNHSGPLPIGTDLDRFVCEVVAPPGGGAPYYPHPIFLPLAVDVFEGSAQLIHRFTDTDYVPFALTDGEPEIVLPEEVEKPIWDGRTLSYRGFVIREITKPAANVRLLLDSFEEADWPITAIRNPFDVAQVSGYPNPEQTLKDTIRDFHRRIVTKGVFRFGSQDKWNTVYWEAVDE
jgi:hypothetical protein